MLTPNHLNPTNLKGRRLLFVQAILNGFAPKQAATTSGYSEKTATQASSRLMNDPEIKYAIQQALDLKEITLDQLEQVRKLAMTKQDPQAAVKAIELEAQITGVL